MKKQFKLTELRENLAQCERFSHLELLDTNREFYKSVLKEVDGVNYELIYHAAAASVTKRNTEIDRLQRTIYSILPHDEATAIIDGAPLALQRTVLRDKEHVSLKQRLDSARVIRDRLVEKTPTNAVDHAYQIVTAQGSVNQAKKSLYTYLQETRKSRYSHQDIKHRDL